MLTGVFALWLLRISIHAPREGGDDGAWYVGEETLISIHAPREGGDLLAEDNDLNAEIATEISIHAPREGGDHAPQLPMPQKHGQFQSTPPARGATGLPFLADNDIKNFNPRPPRGGRRPSVSLSAVPTGISIHAPREGGDAVQYLVP